MEQQPDDKADTDRTAAPEQQPALFKSVNGWIAGATGVVIALGGLATAWNQIFPSRTEEQPAALAAPADAEQPAAAEPAAAPADDVPVYYEGDGATLEFVDNQWILTTDGKSYEYKEMLSPSEDRVLAYDKANDEYLRWPVKGGMSETSKDEANWTNWINLDPTDPPAEE